LFFALWPSDALRTEIRAKTGALVESSQGRLILPANLHITLVFLGNVPVHRLTAADQAAARVHANACEQPLERIESWSGSKILSLTSVQIAPELLALVEALRHECKQRDFKLDDRAYRPHVTLARGLSRVPAAQHIDPVIWPAQEFVLVESRASREGSNYTVLQRWPLL
jgi:2'-5' RNA ligase